MFPDTCRFCEHVNPPDAKFCNACGGALHLLPCPRCGAVSDVTATSCYQCHSPLPGRGNSAPDVPQPAAELPKAAPRSYKRALVGTAIFAVISVAGYLGYREASHLGAAQSPDMSSRVDDRGNPQGGSVTPRSAMAGDINSGMHDNSTRSVSTAAAQPKTARVATAPVVRAKSTNEGRVAERAPLRLDACTKAVAALGLCTLKPAQEMGTKSAATVKPVIARSKAGDAGKAGQRDVQRQDACTDGVAALGLCAPGPKQEGK